ncbi:hypothetical protein EYB53_001905, partial [Candidatus Chloroploca sp. M-50]
MRTPSAEEIILSHWVMVWASTDPLGNLWCDKRRVRTPSAEEIILGHWMMVWAGANPGGQDGLHKGGLATDGA